MFYRSKTHRPDADGEKLLKKTTMFRRSDFFIIIAVLLSFIVSAFLWFVEQDQQQAIFTAIWIPAILTFGIYFKLCALLSIYHNSCNRR